MKTTLIKTGDKVVCTHAVREPVYTPGVEFGDFSFPGGYIEEGATYCVQSVHLNRDGSLGLALVGKPILYKGIPALWTAERFRRVSGSEEPPLDYFKEPEDPADEIIHRIKGNYRKAMVVVGIDRDGLEGVPELWKRHDLHEKFKAMMEQDDPRYRAGEDLPDLGHKQMEIARVTQFRGDYDDVVSLRASLHERSGWTHYTFEDEYGTRFSRPLKGTVEPITAEQVVAAFREVEPSPLEAGCDVFFHSLFYEGLNDIAKSLLAK